MLARILVPLDGSSRAERALAVAARAARAAHSTLLLLRVVSTPAEYGPHLAPSMLTPAAIEAERTEAQAYLQALARHEWLAGLAVETGVVAGAIVPSILDYARTSHADLIVIASHGRTGLTRWVLGSAAEKIARHAPVPVFVVRESGPVPAGPHPDAERPLRALVALDGSPLAEEALAPTVQLVSALASPARGALHLVRVLPLVAGPAMAGGSLVESVDQESVLGQARSYLTDTVERLRQSEPVTRDMVITWSVALDQDVADALVRVAEGGEDAEGAGVFGGCDFIAMATHGRGGLQLWALGSVTERVLHATKLPLLIVRPERRPQENLPGAEQIADINGQNWPGLL